MNNTIFVKVGDEFIEKEIKTLSVIIRNVGLMVYVDHTILTKDGILLHFSIDNKAKSDVIYLTEKDVMKDKHWEGFTCSQINDLCKKKYEDKELCFKYDNDIVGISFKYHFWNGNHPEYRWESFGDCRFEYDFSNDTFKCINQYGEINPCYGNGKYKTREECIADNKVKIIRIPKKEEAKSEVGKVCCYTITPNLSIGYKLISGNNVSEEKWFRKYDIENGVDTKEDLMEILKEFEDMVSPNGDYKFIYNKY